MLDRYLLEHELGAGARGVVYRARDRDNGRQVAVKLSADTAVSPNPDGSAPHFAEAVPKSLRAHLVHPSIPVLYDSGRAGHLSFEAFELVNGSDLGSHSNPATLLPLPTVLSIGAQIADALHYAHQHGVIHGDVKPANIIFDATTGRAVLTDFPSGSQRDDERGTPAYKAPECLRDAKFSPASDQFSLGLSLYRLVCGHHPFTGRSRPQIVRELASGHHTDPRVYIPSLPPLLAHVFDNALAKEPRLRYSDVNAMKEAIACVQAHLSERASACSAPCRSLVR